MVTQGGIPPSAPPLLLLLRKWARGNGPLRVKTIAKNRTCQRGPMVVSGYSARFTVVPMVP
jgi:hypothetical protein